MSITDTEERIVSVICEHFLSGKREKLTILVVSERAGISRQAFHKNYLHLKPFITGQRNVDELLLRQGVNTSKVILQTQKLLRDVEAELQEVRSSQDTRFEKFENNILTSLMASDILTHRAKELTAALRKKALHIEVLKRELDEKEVELALANSNSESIPPPAYSKNLDIHIFKPDLAAAIASFANGSDPEAYLALKDKAISAMQQKVLKILRKITIRVVVFQERYLCSFEKFINRNFSDSTSIVIINLPIYSRIDLKYFIQSLKGAIPLELYAPYCESEAVINAQRGFLFRNIPEFEFKSSAEESLPTIHDGYDRVTIFRVTQGD